MIFIEKMFIKFQAHEDPQKFLQWTSPKWIIVCKIQKPYSSGTYNIKLNQTIQGIHSKEDMKHSCNHKITQKSDVSINNKRTHHDRWIHNKLQWNDVKDHICSLCNT